MLCYIKNPTGGFNYYLANRALVNEEFLIEQLRKSKTTFSSPFITESQIGYAILFGLYGFFCYKLINNLYA